LGGSVLLKCLTEEKMTKAIAGLFLIAAPYWGAEDWEVDEYILPNDFAARLPKTLPIFFYHSRDDDTIPFVHWWADQRYHI
jgi:predicted alpha/beta hydrolase family esterase